MIKNLKMWWRQIRCKHTRSVKFFPGVVDCTVQAGKTVEHRCVVFEGCLNCGKTTVRDYGA